MGRMHTAGPPTVAGAFALVLVAGAVGCGTAQRNPDAGDGSITTPAPDALGAGWHPFDVVAVLRPAMDASVSVPPLDRFTFVIDPAAGRAIVGGKGRGAVVGITTDDGRTFRSAGPFTVGDSNNDACGVSEDMIYESLEVTIAGASLSGSARGQATVSCGDCAFLVPFTATVTGTVDATPPALLGRGLTPPTPFDGITLATSEPLPVGATARLVADDGVAVDLVPAIVEGDLPLVVGFSKPDVVLRAGHAYSVALDGLIDFAGLTDPGGPPLRLAAFEAAPATLEDGFETVPGGAFGGAMVMTAGPLPAIAGNTSLYVGGAGAPALDASRRSLMIRLPRQAGDTKLRFSYRVVAAQTLASFSGVVWVGSEGASPGPATYGLRASGPGDTLTIAGNPVVASVAAAFEVPLPAGATDEVLLSVAPISSACFRGPTGNVGLLIDDLRLE
jgi:hypothetical protein